MSSNYPPGVTGNEPQIVGDVETEAKAEIERLDRFVVSTPELFVCNGGGMWFTIHGRDEDGREYQIADLGDCGEFSTVLEPHEAAYYAKLFAAAPKLAKAVELAAEVDRVGIVFAGAELLGRRRLALKTAQKALAELEDGK